MNLLLLDRVPILEQLRIEEALLRADRRNWCIVNRGSPPAIVMGISGRAEKLIDHEKWSRAPIPIIKRFSGGGTVVIDENTLFVTFICNAGFVPVSPFPEAIMRWTAELYRPLFAPEAFSLKENDFVIGHKKFGGNAQTIIKNRWLHHSSLLWDYCPDKMDYLLLPPKVPPYRQGRSHSDFLCKLADFWPCQASFHQQLIEYLKKQLEMEIVHQDDIQKVLSLPHRKATTIENTLKGTGHCAINTVCTGGSVS